MARFTREEHYFRQLMEADEVVWPALVREWSRNDKVLGERLTGMLETFSRPEVEDDQDGQPRRFSDVALAGAPAVRRAG